MKEGLPFFTLVALLCGPLSAADAPPFEEILKIDVHAHIFEDLPQLVEMLRRANTRMINICNRGRDGHLETMHRIALELYRKYPDLFPFASTFDLTRLEEAGYADEVIQWLEGTFQNGAVMTKIWKEVGMEVQRSDGSFVMPDDPVFDPIYAYLAKRDRPLMAHLADPIEAWLPLDPKRAHYAYFSAHPEYHLYGRAGYPTHAQLMAARDHVLEKHPRLTVIGAHLGSFEHDTDELAQRLDRYPNFFVDCAARTGDLARQPSAKVRAFFLKYQDRILYGSDINWKPYRETQPLTGKQRQTFAHRLEDRYRQDYRYYAASGPVEYNEETVEGLALPREVLEKFYHGNAERLILRETARR